MLEKINEFPKKKASMPIPPIEFIKYVFALFKVAAASYFESSIYLGCFNYILSY